MELEYVILLEDRVAPTGFVPGEGATVLDGKSLGRFDHLACQGTRTEHPREFTFLDSEGRPWVELVKLRSQFISGHRRLCHAGGRRPLRGTADMMLYRSLQP
jgi:hypothetical protein